MRRPFRVRLCAAAVSLVLIAGCSPSEPVSPSPSVAATVPPSAAVASEPLPTGPVAVASSGARPIVAAGLELAEIRFAPLPGDPQFVEIANAGSAAVPLAGLSLGVDGTALPIAPTETSLGPGERLLVVLDGAKDPETYTVHMAGATLGAAGTVDLLDGAHVLLDRVAWGAGKAHAVALSTGDFAIDTVAPGTSIGRPPGAVAAFQPTDWVPYPPSSTTPGAPNSIPAVASLLPMNGAVLESQARLAWYPVPGASAYRVQVATDSTFATPAVDAQVADSQIDVSSLAAGRYVWRVEAIVPDGTASAMSDHNGFEKTAGVVQIAPAAFHPEDPVTGGPLRADDPGRHLDVGWLPQHKDTKMLLLEEPHEKPPMAWNEPHNPPSGLDPADAKNCAVTMVAMVNHFYGGDLSEDRIGYQVLKDTTPGPELDLVWGLGLSIPQTNAAFAYALGAPVTFVPEYATYDDAWDAITESIDAGRPVPGANTHHGFVITGYSIRPDGHRIIWLNDPAYGKTSSDIDAPGRASSTDLSLWILPDHLTGTKQEASVTTDSDGDGVVDFDETERFHTDAHNKDSDDDKVKDLEDIASSVFDPTYGYAFHPVSGGKGRDFDGDAKPPETDPDSDDGGCLDGDEDKDVDGHRNGTETWNFDKADDSCFDLQGTITYERVSTNDAGNGEGADATLHATIDVKLKTDPNDPTHLVDAGSSYTVDNVFTSQRPNGSDCSPARHISRSNGTYRFSDPPIPSPGHTLEQLGVDANTHPDIWAYMDRQRGVMGIAIVPWFPETVEDTCQLFSSPLALPIVIDDWVCGSDFSGLNLSIDARIGEAPSGPLPVTVDCHQERPAFLWQSQKITARGQLRLVGH